MLYTSQTWNFWLGLAQHVWHGSSNLHEARWWQASLLDTSHCINHIHDMRHEPPIVASYLRLTRYMRHAYMLKNVDLRKSITFITLCHYHSPEKQMAFTATFEFGTVSPACILLCLHIYKSKFQGNDKIPYVIPSERIPNTINTCLAMHKERWMYHVPYNRLYSAEKDPLNSTTIKS